MNAPRALNHSLSLFLTSRARKSSVVGRMIGVSAVVHLRVSMRACEGQPPGCSY